MRLTTERTKKVDVPNDLDGGFINIIALDLNMITQIEARSSNMSFGDGDSTNVSYDNVKREDGIAKACLKGWGNFFDVKGKDIPFKNSNFKDVAKFAIDVKDKRVRFFEWVADEHDKFYNEVLEEEGEAAKNS